MKICVVTSYAAAVEPRAPRHAIAAKLAFPDARVVFVDLVAAGVPRGSDPELLSPHAIERKSVEFPTRASGIARLAIRKLRTRLAHVAFAAFGLVQESVFGERTQGLTRELQAINADVYIAHNIETLLPAIRAADATGATVVFDCMEFYSDMGDSQLEVEAAAARALESKVLRRCALVLASSDTMADALAAEYGIARPLAAYNVPPKADVLPPRKGGGLNLYWRNTTIGFGQRGLEDALMAMRIVPQTVCLALQGRLPEANAKELRARAKEFGIEDRVRVLPPYAPHEAVVLAAQYDVGLCLERRGPRNHDLTVSNKMFDYHMAGLAVIATDLPALADVLQRSGGGAVCEPGDPKSLAAVIRGLHDDPQQLQSYQQSARAFALTTGNLDVEIDKIVTALRDTLDRRRAA